MGDVIFMTLILKMSHGHSKDTLVRKPGSRANILTTAIFDQQLWLEHLFQNHLWAPAYVLGTVFWVLGHHKKWDTKERQRLNISAAT